MRSVILLALWVSGVCNAGNLVVNGRITKVTNTYFNEASFAITVVGGSNNLCPGVITFPLSAAANADAHNRAYAAALLALTTGQPVRVYNYNGNSCDQASFIEIGLDP